MIPAEFHNESNPVLVVLDVGDEMGECTYMCYSTEGVDLIVHGNSQLRTVGVCFVKKKVQISL